jgi:pimeloyl-ACP methyl ester carboxylesterase
LEAVHPRLKVFLYQGEDDEDVPADVGRHIESRLPNCEAKFLEGESHSMIRRVWGEVLGQLVSSSAAAAAYAKL